MADYREHYDELRATGATLVAVSVDPPDRSETLRHQLSLPFPILCDTARSVVKEWDIYNAREKGGIARPAVFLIDQDRRVRYASVDTVARRVPPSEIIRVLKSTTEIQNAQRHGYLPRFADWRRALRNALQKF